MKHQLHHFYHVYADGTWQDKAEDHVRALKKYELYDNLSSFNVGLVGSDENAGRVIDFLEENNTKYTIVAHETTGWEQITLDPLWEMAKLNKNAYFVYGHTKGAANFHANSEVWRRGMTRTNIVEWQKCIQALNEGYSTVGCHYYPGREDQPYAFWGGNFWWATSAHVRSLDICRRASRYDAEAWIGSAYQLPEFNPKDLWPVPIFSPSEPY